MRFAHPEILWLLWALPALVVVFYFARKSARRRTLMFIGSDLEQQLVIGRRDRRRMGRAALLLLVLSQLILAAARPQWGANKVEVEQKGSDVVIALDISRSMLAEDIKPSRLTRAKVELADLMDDLNGDRVGLVFFAGAAFPQCPLTVDYSAARLFLSQADPTMIGSQGTNIEAAMSTALELFREEKGGYRAVILVTDGEDFAGGLTDITRKLQDAGVVVFPIGMGSSGGAPIPVYNDQHQREGFLRDENQQVVMTHLKEEPLVKLARDTGGIYVRAGSGGVDLARLSAGLSSLQSRAYQATRVTSYQERYAWPLSAALLLLLLEPLFSDRRRGE
jgi:Ca-activated chloride channel family protein